MKYYYSTVTNIVTNNVNITDNTYIEISSNLFQTLLEEPDVEFIKED
jgi:hypothetical protein